MSVVAAHQQQGERLSATERAAAVLLEHLPLETGVQSVRVLPHQSTVVLESKGPLAVSRRVAVSEAATRVLAWFGLADAVAIAVAGEPSQPLSGQKLTTAPLGWHT